MSGCSSRERPAPVVLLNSQPEEDLGYTDPTYTVMPGDTLFAIAWYTGNDYRDIARYNQLSPPYQIRAGQVLQLSAPKIVKRPSSLSKSRNGRTTKNKSTNNVDQPKEQAYGESENNVNNQQVKVVKKPAESVRKPANNDFPDRVRAWSWPAKGKLTGTFSQAENGNKGIDISASRGTAIRAAAAGKVVYAGNALRGYGNLIIIKHTDSFLSAYAHNDELMVKEQQWVDEGQQIAIMGNSGTDSVKLHFEVRYRGKSLDPLRYLPTDRP